MKKAILAGAAALVLLFGAMTASAQIGSTNGTVVASSTTSVTVKTTDGVQKTYTIDKTSVMPTAALRVGDRITVDYNTLTAGDMVVTRVTVVPGTNVAVVSTTPATTTATTTTNPTTTSAITTSTSDATTPVTTTTTTSPSYSATSPSSSTTSSTTSTNYATTSTNDTYPDTASPDPLLLLISVLGLTAAAGLNRVRRS